MTEQIHLTPNLLRPIEPQTPQPPAGQGSEVGAGPSFQQVLESKIGTQQEVRFSAHAQKRMDAREIRLTEMDLGRLRQGVEQAGAKGARESLILMDNLAFVVSVPNRTVVTAVDGPQQRGAVFTQIDSAVFV